MLWVHATLLESIPLVYERLVSRCPRPSVTRIAKRRRRSRWRSARANADIPRTWEALGGYIWATMDSGVIAVGVEAQQLAEAVLAPPVGRVVWPATRVNRLVTIGLLPAAIQEQYGFTWSARDERRLARVLRVVKRVRRSVPARLALWPEARRHGGRPAMNLDRQKSMTDDRVDDQIIDLRSPMR